MPSPRRLALTIAAVLLLCTFFLTIGKRRVRPSATAPLAASQPSEQRQRIDRTIDFVADLSVQQAVESLSEYNETFELASLASLSSASIGSLYLNQIRGDRRVAKIWQYLDSLPAERAEAISSAMADQKISEYHSHYAGRESDPNWPRHESDPKRHAASAALFFCSYFCMPETLDAKMQEWDRLMSSNQFAIGHGPSGDYWKSLLRYDPLFGANLLVISGARQGRSVQDLNQRLESQYSPGPQYESPFTVETANLFRSDALTVDTDFTAVTRGAAFDNTDIIVTFPAFLNPDASLFVAHVDDASQRSRELYDLIRHWRDDV